MDRKDVANLLQKALDFATDLYDKMACRYGLCSVIYRMLKEGQITKEEYCTLNDVVEELLKESKQRLGRPDDDYVFLWVGIARYHNFSLTEPQTEKIFPLWRQAYEDRIKELETGVHHG